MTATGMLYVVLDGAAQDDHLQISRSVTIIGRGKSSFPAQIGTHDYAGPTVLIDDGNDIKFYTLIVDGGYGPEGDGIVLSSAGTLTLDQVQIAHNARYGLNISSGRLVMNRSAVGMNDTGGIHISNASFDIENSQIVENGLNAPSNVGGITIESSTGNPDTIRFSTIATNEAAGSGVGGVLCSNESIEHQTVFTSDLIVDNNTNNTPDVAGAFCVFSYSDIFPQKIPGSGNLNADPVFFLPGDYHLVEGSVGIDTADPSATDAIDYDGSTRPQGSGYDMGAYEYIPGSDK